MLNNKRKSHLQQQSPGKGQGNQRLTKRKANGLYFPLRKAAHIPTGEPAKCEGTLELNEAQ